MNASKTFLTASRLFLTSLVLTSMGGCKDLAGTPPLPAGTISPSIVQNLTGAVQTAVAAQVIFQTAFADYIQVAGVMTDELTASARDKAFNVSGLIQQAVNYGLVSVDERLLDQATVWSPVAVSLSSNITSTDTVYTRLQQVRELAAQAIGGLAIYAPDSTALRGEMYALAGYAELMLGDLYCSGVPLTTLDYQGDYTYQPGSTTKQIYNQAIAKFDTAQTLAASNAQVVNLAKVGQGRAYLALGQYAQAGQAVTTVPTTFQFSDSIYTCGINTTTCGSTISAQNYFISAKFFWYNGGRGGASVSDREGGTGLPYVSSHDPRTADTADGNTLGGTATVYFPKKYQLTGVNAFLLASGLEAQLITAEADLNAGNTAGMFTILNALRQGNPATSGLPVLTDPSTFGAEVDTLFTERAAWLFVDGHRQGDLRRLQRNYVNGQGITVVANQYPNGPYGYGGALYGPFIDAPVPATELANPLFTGCLSRD